MRAWGRALPTACLGHLEHCSSGSRVVCREPWLLVEQEHVLQMPPSAVVQAALQGWEPHRSLSCSGFPLSPDSALGNSSSLGDAPSGRRGWQRRLLEPVESPSSARTLREEGSGLDYAMTLRSFSPSFPFSSPA